MAETIAAQLDKGRNALLDLSTRNRLLSLPKRSSSNLLNIHDELTAEVYRLLVVDGKSMSFLPGKAGVETSAETDEDDEAGVLLPQPDDDQADEKGVASRHRDLKLQTKLASDKLQHRLLEMFYDARTFIEEQGVNILYLALGQLKWFDKNAPDKPRYAPLILLPVSLQRKSAAERFSVTWLEEDAADNLSLAAKLKADFGLILPEFKSGDDFEPLSYLAQVGDVISTQAKWEVLRDEMALGFFSFAKFLMYRDLDPLNWPAGHRIDQQKLIVALMQDGFRSSGSLFPENVDIDQLLPVAEQRHVVDADSSQSLAIEAVRKGENLVIQGPPGTGKSQTITNVIAAAIADGKKVLFVSEKMAALEVVHRRLNAIGLGPACLELHSNRSNKRVVLEELKTTKDLGKPKVVNRDQVLNDLDHSRGELNKHSAVMHTLKQPAGLTPFQVVGHLARLRATRLSGLPPLLERPEDWSAEGLRTRKIQVDEYCQVAGKLGEISRHPWRGVSLGALLKLDADQLFEQIGPLRKQLGELQTRGATLANALDQPSAETQTGLRAQIELGLLLGTAPEVDRAAVANAIWSSGLNRLASIVEVGAQWHRVSKNLQLKFADSAWQEDIGSCRRLIAAHGDSLFRVFVGEYRRAIALVKSHLKTALPDSLPQRVALLDELIAAQALRKALNEANAEGTAAFGRLWQGEESDWGQLQAVVQWMQGANGNGLPEAFRELYARVPAPGQCATLAQDAKDALNAFIAARAVVFDSYKLDLAEAFPALALEQLAFDEQDRRLADWESHPDALFDWINFYSARANARAAGLAELTRQFETGSIELANMAKVFERAYYEKLLREMSQSAPQIASFNGEQHDRKVAAFRTLDLRRIELARAEAALKHYEGIPHIQAGVGPMAILNGEIARKRGHMPLRKLFKLAGDAIQAIKPVFMMSPLSVAQFLEPGAISFDMLVIDEASQIEPIDALGAVARCKQLVVVGDDRQLPPTRFFSRMTSDHEDVDESDDEAYIASAKDVESILSLCMAKGMPELMLRWHYRSRHQSLIAVSNQQFYKNELFIVPSPYTASAKTGLRFNHVANGTFDSGGTRINREEAKVIAKAIIDHAKTLPQQSLGVAAFSLQQKIAIQDELELLRRQHPETEAFFSAHPNEPFFIKNLENVQGDERDVIFISVAYARNSAGYLPMRFGPVSLEGGERRLNVLISRAKLRCEVFSSIKAEDIDLERGKGKGVIALKVFLNFAETGRLNIAARSGLEMDSPFEEEVKRALSERGFILHQQIGLAGFFIDLAIVDEQQPGRYLLGIECDGVTYHSSPSARDRDRLRQHVLEDHGWILHRIWSCDWFRQPDAEIAKLVTAAESARTELAARDNSAAHAAQLARPHINLVERDEGVFAAVADASLSGEAYQEARFAVIAGQELHEVPVARLAQFIKQIIDAEGPIHFDEVITRLRTLWGLQRAGARIREAMEKGKQVLLSDRVVVTQDQFLDIPGRITRIRDRSLVSSASLRKPEYLPLSEIREAIKKVLRESLGGQRDELPVAVSRMFGFAATSAQLRELIFSNLDELHRTGQVQLHGEIYRVAA